MKKVVIVAVCLGMLATLAYAGVRNIRNNGKVSGVPSYLVECASGSDYVIYKKNGTWYRGDIGHMGNKYDSWSTDQVADYICR